MERTTTSSPANNPVTSGAVGAAPPRRRWSDGPNYPWSPGTEEAWSVATHWPALVAVLCEQVAEGTTDLSAQVERLHREGRMARTDANAMRRAVQGMRSAGMALQQIVRLGAGLYNLSPDRVELAVLARDVVRDRQRELLRRGVEVSFELNRAEVWVDGAIAAGIVQAGIDWALSFSRRVRIKVEPGDGSDPARVVVRAALPHASRPRTQTATRRNRRMNDNLHWILMRQLAASARLPISRSSTAATEAAVIEFPATITIAPRRVP